MTEPWNLLDFGILAIFMTSFMARLMAFWHAYSAQCYVDKHYTDVSNTSLPFEIQYFQLGKCPSGIMKCSFSYHNEVISGFCLQRLFTAHLDDFMVSVLENERYTVCFLGFILAFKILPISLSTSPALDIMLHKCGRNQYEGHLFSS